MRPCLLMRHCTHSLTANVTDFFLGQFDHICCLLPRWIHLSLPLMMTTFAELHYLSTFDSRQWG